MSADEFGDARVVSAGMADEQMTASTTINAAPEAVFAVLIDPNAHAAIDGTGWVRGPIDPAPLTHTGQIFRMAMYHENHPDKDYEMANRVEVSRRPAGHRVAARARSRPRPVSSASADGPGATTWRRPARHRRP